MSMYDLACKRISASLRRLEDPGPAELYCDYCERYGHAFSSCPRRDDSVEEEDAVDE